jgi:hypothetical protein
VHFAKKTQSPTFADDMQVNSGMEQVTLPISLQASAKN